MEIVSPPFSRRSETQKLVERFNKMAPNEVIDYSEVKKLIGEDPQSSVGRSITNTARKAVLRENQIFIECVPRVGFQRGTEPAKIAASHRQIKKVRGAVKRGVKVIKSVDTSELNGEQQRELTITVAWLGALNQATRVSIGKKIVRVLDAATDVETKSGGFLKLMIERKGG
jgi:hypothetical protein